MKILPTFIFTILGNVIDNIEDSYFEDNGILVVNLDREVVNECIHNGESISDGYIIRAEFHRRWFKALYAENEDGARIDLVDDDELFGHLDFTNTNHIFEAICALIYTSAPNFP